MSDCPMCDADLQKGWAACPTCGHKLEEAQAEKKSQNQQILLALVIVFVLALFFVFYLVDFQALGF